MSYPYPPHQAPQPPKRRGRGPIIALLVAFAVLIAGAVGCAAVLSAVDTSTGSITSSDLPATTDPDTAPAPAAGDRPEGNPRYGQTATFDDGSTLTCGKPVKFTPSRDAFGGEKAKQHLKVKCTFYNGADETFEPALTTLSMTADGVEGESVYQTGLDAPDNPVLPGKKVTWWAGYGVDSTRDVQLTVSLGFLDYDSVTYSD